MKKICALLALLCVLVCTTCPVFANEVASDISTAETAQAGDDMAGATTDSANALTNLMNGVKEKWEELFGGLEGVLEFTTVCVGGAIGCLPSSFALYLIMLSVCVAVVAIFKALGGKDK